MSAPHLRAAIERGDTAEALKLLDAVLQRDANAIAAAHQYAEKWKREVQQLERERPALRTEGARDMLARVTAAFAEASDFVDLKRRIDALDPAAAEKAHAITFKLNPYEPGVSNELRYTTPAPLRAPRVDTLEFARVEGARAMRDQAIHAMSDAYITTKDPADVKADLISVVADLDPAAVGKDPA